MKLLLGIVALLAIVVSVPVAATAQDDNRDRLTLGVFADYLRLGNADNANYWGIGGRLGFGIAPHLNLEADMAYDFEKTVFNVFTATEISGMTVTSARSNGLRLWHGSFGPMLWFGSDRARIFVVAKGGFLDFNVSNQAPFTGFTNVVSTFGSGNTNGVFYPGGGAELAVGPLGFRIDIGDMIYFDRGANHNLSVKAGPILRF